MVLLYPFQLSIATFAPVAITEFSGMGRGNDKPSLLSVGLSATDTIEANTTLMEIDLDHVMYF